MEGEKKFRSYNDELCCYFYFINGKYYSQYDFEKELSPEVFNWSRSKQCTGVKDKHEVEIYEGDIVTEGFYKFKVVYSENNSSFCIKPFEELKDKSFDLSDFISFERLGNGYLIREDLEIIGSIYD